MKQFLIFLITVFCFEFSCAQSPELFVTANTNMYFPIDSDKEIFPVLGYNKNLTPKLLIGGFGAGVAALFDKKDRHQLRAQANLSSFAYWNETLVFRSENNVALGMNTPRGYDYTLGISGSLHYFLTKKFSVGTGIGTRVMLSSVATYDLGPYSKDDKPNPIRIRNYKTIMPLVPVELTLRFPKTYYSTKCEFALLNKFRGDLGKAQRESYIAAFIEVGFKVSE